ENDVERVLLFLSLNSSASGTCSGDGGSSGDLELVLERLDEVVELDEGQACELLEQLLSGELSHGVSPRLMGFLERARQSLTRLRRSPAFREARRRLRQPWPSSPSSCPQPSQAEPHGSPARRTC